MKILLISPFLYGSAATHGGAVLSWRQLELLAVDHELAFVGFDGIELAKLEEAFLADLTRVCRSVSTTKLKLNFAKVFRTKLACYLLKRPMIADLMLDSRMTSLINEGIATFKPDIIWVQFPQMAQYVNACGELPVVMDVQDAYTISSFRNYRLAGGFNRFVRFIDWINWTRYEATLYPRFSAVMTLSSQDAVTLSALSPRIRSHCIGLPIANAVTNQKYSAIPNRVGFAGSFGHLPNVEALEFFLSKVWPLIRARHADAKFFIAGKNPPIHLLKYASDAVEFLGFVPDITQFYAENWVTVSPLVSGGGVKIKTAEAMVAGSAIVATHIGAEGTGALHGVNILIADDADEFAKEVVRVLEDSALQKSLAQQAHFHGGEYFSGKSWQYRVNDIIEDAVRIESLKKFSTNG